MNEINGVAATRNLKKKVRPGRRRRNWERQLGGTTCITVQRYVSNAASFVFYGTTCLMRLVESAALFAAFEEGVH